MSLDRQLRCAVVPKPVLSGCADEDSGRPSATPPWRAGSRGSTGMHARSTTFRGDPGAIADGIAHVQDEVLPAVRQMDGCIGLSMLVDRHTGRCIVTTSWDDAEAMHRSAEAFRGIRETTTSTVRGVEGETEVVEWQIGVLHRVRSAPPGAAARMISTRGPLGQTDRTIE